MISPLQTRFGRALDHAPTLLLLLVLGIFGFLAPSFLTASNLANLLVQASSTAVVGVGMTFVLLTAGVDLSVGSIMFVAAAVAGKLSLAGLSLPGVILAILFVGVTLGALNAILITRLGILSFVATLGMLYIGRGFGLWLTQTRALNLPDSFLWLGATRVVGIPLPLFASAMIIALAHLTLNHTPFGRQILAVGAQPEAARKAGLDTRRLIAAVYVISGLCAALGGLLSLGQLGTVSPTFGTNREFAAIAAAVLGGTSLFGGRGGVFPGTVLGAVLMQTVENGLVILNADPYLYPLFTSAIIFVAVLLDSTRTQWIARQRQRRIMPETQR